MPERMNKGSVLLLWFSRGAGLLVNLYGRTLRKYARFFSVVFICCLMAPSCAPLPEYARPQFYRHAGIVTDTDNSGFSYRLLSIDDFKAEMLPPDVQQYQESINARSCLTIRPSDMTSAQIGAVSYYGNPLWIGQFRHLSFEALFIPSCSWWNENVSQKKIDYVLQHEQIHFAIAELTARRATSELGQKMKDYTALGGTRSEVAEELNRVLQDSVYEFLESDLEIHTEFDEDTSLFFDQDQQDSWYSRLTHLLEQSHGIP